MEDGYICKIATPAEMQRKWDYEIACHPHDRENWLFWKQQALQRAQSGLSIPYYGLLGENIICEATAMLDATIVQNGEGLTGGDRVYLSAFRTVDDYRGQGYFSRLLSFLLADLRRRGFRLATLGVEPSELTNQSIYAHYGFGQYLKSGTETYPDGTAIAVDYYAKPLV